MCRRAGSASRRSHALWRGRARTGRRDERPARGSTFGGRCGLGCHAEIVSAAEDGLRLTLAPALAQEIPPLESRVACVGTAAVRRQEINGTPVRVDRARLVALESERTGQSVNGGALCVTVKIAQQR